MFNDIDRPTVFNVFQGVEFISNETFRMELRNCPLAWGGGNPRRTTISCDASFISMFFWFYHGMTSWLREVLVFKFAYFITLADVQIVAIGRLSRPT